MPIKVTRNWSSQRLSWAAPWRATITFDVSGTTDVAAALSAVDADTPSIHVFQQNEACDLPGSARLKCKGPTIAEVKGPAYFVVSCEFEIPPTGEFGDTPEDPLAQPPVIGWEQVELGQPVDIDLDGRVICAKNGEPLPPGDRPIIYYRLRILKNMPYFDFALSQSFSNSVNNAALSLAGVPVAAEHMRCASIIPAAEYLSTALYVPMAFYFEIFFDDALGLYPFQHRYLNAGTYGHWSDGGTIRRGGFTNGKSEPVDRPVRLNLTGLPTGPDSFAKVFGKPGDQASENQTPVALSSVPTTYQTEPLPATGTPDAYALYFKRVRLVNLSTLLSVL